MQNKTKLVQTIISLVVFVLIFVAMLFYEGVFKAETKTELFTALSNAFVVPGSVLFSIGMLSFVASKGMFDGFGYIFSNFAKHFIIPSRPKNKYESYYDYVARKAEKRGEWLYILAIVGGIALVIGIVLAIIAG